MRNNIKDLYPVNSIQKSILFHSDNDMDNYAVKISLDLHGIVIDEKVTESFKEVIRRHDSLRTIFPQGNYEKMMQVVLKEMEATFHIVETNNTDDVTSELFWKKEEAFNLEKGPLIKGCLFKGEDRTLRLDFLFHHIVIDGWSLDIFLREFFHVYAGKTLGEAPAYNSYVKWLMKEDMEKGKDYFKEYLGDYLDEVKLEEPISEEKKVLMKRFTIPEEMISPVINRGKEAGITMSTIFQAIWGLTINKLYGRQDVVFGNVVSGRNVPVENIENTIGLFINTLPVRVKYEKDEKLIGLLERMQKASTMALELESYPLDKIINNHPLSQGLFNHIIGIENYDLDLSSVTEETGLKINRLTSKEQSHFPLNIAIYPGKDVEFLFTWHSDCYREEKIDEFVRAIKAVTNAMKDGFHLNVSDIQVVNPEDLRMITEDFNQTNYPCLEETDFKHFVTQVFEKAGDLEAVTDGAETWTYKELHLKASAIAKRIKEAGFQANDIIAIYENRSIDLYPMIFGVVLSGCAFLLLDPSLPDERLEGILEDSKAGALLVKEDENLPFNTSNAIVMRLGKNEFENKELFTIEGKMQPLDTTYIIYTSGTTGKPKGVLLTSEASVNMADYFGRYMGCIEPISISVSPLSFDMFVCDVFYNFARHGKMIITTEAQRKDNEEIARLIIQEKADTILTTPSRLSSLIYTNEISMKNMKTMAVGGEKITEKLVEEVSNKTNGRLFNGYGPTEATAYNTMLEMNQETKHLLGKPAAFSEIYVMNEEGNPMPVGIVGEICIGGTPLAKGYLNRPDLTNEKFVDHPLKPGKKIYKTGDLGRWTKDGNLEYLGRKDDQVKIRGLRIETQEIEKVISSVSGVKLSTIFAITNAAGQDELACVYTGENKNYESIINEIKSKLPEYMIPVHMLHVEMMKTTRTGKFDKKYYSDYFSEKRKAVGQKTPVTEIQKKLFAIWAEILNHENFGCESSFFNVGGNSLTAMMLCAKVKNAFGKVFTLKDLFSSASIEKQEQFINGNVSKYENRLEKIAKMESYPLTNTEERLFSVLETIPVGSKMYNIIQALEVKGIEVNKLKIALTQIVNRHDNLRSNYQYNEDGKVRKYIRDQEEAELEIYHVNTCKEDELSSLTKAFQLGSDRLYQFILAKDQEREILILNFHHIIMDGNSIGLFVQELIDILSGKTANGTFHQFQDYAVFEEKYIQSSEYKDAKTFWNKMMTGFEVSSGSSSNNQESKGRNATFSLESDVFEKLKRTANHLNLTMYQLTFSIFSLLRSRTANTNDYITGTVSSGRFIPECERILGMMVNTLPVRLKYEKNETVREILLRQKDVIIEAISNEAYPLHKILKNVNEMNGTEINSLFNEMFILQEFDEKGSIKVESGEIHTLQMNLHVTDTKFPLTVEGERKGNKIEFLVNYDEAIYEGYLIENMMLSYFNILENIDSVLDCKVKEIDFLTKQERNTLMSFHGDVDTSERPITIQEHMDRIMEIYKDRIACETKFESLTYEELNITSKNLAKRIHHETKGVNRPVAVLMGRTKYIPIAVMGILRANASFILIDTELPMERIEYMLEVTEASFLITDGSLQVSNQYEQWDITRMNLMEEVSLPPIEYSCDDIAYLIFTSGTTGKPKGVINTNRGLVNSLTNIVDLADLCDRLGSELSVTSISFDMFIIEMFMAIGSGRSLVIANEEERLDNELLINLIKEKDVRLSWMTPSRLQGFLANDNHAQIISKLNGVFLGGEALHQETLNKTMDLGDICVFNMYGPSETAVFSSGKKFAHDDMDITIGKPSPGNTIYILGSDNELLSLGSVGEIVIGGIGVGLGYLKDEEQTKKAFVDDPFRPGYKMYRTGDLGIWTKKGEILYIGRADKQVKIRGYRIEISEIENALRKIAGINDAVVIMKKKQGSTYLAAFIVGNFNEMEVANELSNVLPYYMVPEFFFPIEAIPLAHTGKVDLKALDKIEINTSSSDQSEMTETELMVSKFFQRILDCAEVGSMDSFYQLGGDSIKAIQLVGLMKSEGIQITVKDIMAHKNIRGIANFINNSVAKKKVNQGPIEGSFELLPIQTQFIQNNTPDKLFNQSIVFKAEKRELSQYKKIIQELMVHHDILRSEIINQDGKYVHHILPISDIRFSYLEFTKNEDQLETDLAYLGNYAQGLVQPHKGIMVSVLVIQTEHSDYLLMALSHFVVDGVSWRIIEDDLSRIAESLKKNEAIKLPEKTDSMMTYSLMAKKAYEDKFFEKERSYWEANCDGSSDDIDCRMSHIGMDEIRFTDEETFELKSSFVEVGTDLNTALLSSYVNALADIEEKDKVRIFFESHGRLEEMGDLDLSQSIGWFTSMYPVTFSIKQDFMRMLREVKFELEKVPNFGVGFGVMAQGDGEGKLYHTYHSKSKKCFNYLGEIGGSEDNRDKAFHVMDLDRGFELGENVDLSIEITLNAVILNKSLIITVAYNKTLYSEEMIGKLKSSFLNYLKGVVKDDSQVSMLTPSQFGELDTSLDELDSIVDLIGSIK
ncbi:amino acid adenylation domain-containing protein [Gottfriedia acidiceleris]|uniref:amino acid adenylation domain-containing protein n=1 Tax=Gottfriedia acidiceleris TaxID=371036 RepID=UPI002F2678AE